MRQPFFSIIIPTLNEELFLPRLLKSISLQKFRDFEVVIVDGFSEDKTKNVAQLSAPNLSYLNFIQTKIRNVSHQRNLGAQNARGNYLIFFDADTRITPLFLEKLEKQLRSGAVFLTTYYLTDSKLLYDKLFINIMNLIMEVGSLINTPVLIGANVIVKKNYFYKIGGFDEKLKHAEDYTFAQEAKNKNIELKVLRQPRVYFSLRRYKAEGRIGVLRKNAMAAFHILTQGPITKEIFSYQMGGANYVKVKKIKKPLSEKIINYLDTQIRKALISLFEE